MSQYELLGDEQIDESQNSSVLEGFLPGKKQAEAQSALTCLQLESAIYFKQLLQSSK